MKKRPNSQIKFKEYNQNQLIFLPPNLDELIPPNHLVRVVSQAIDKIKIEPLLESYKGGGRPGYHPRMMLKLLVYGYTQRIYSSRKLAKALRENIHFMWLSAGNRPDFRSINRFRSSRLKETIEEVFISITELLLEERLIDLKDYFLDGTKLEANANKYSFVWGKSTKKYKARLKEQVKELLKDIDRENAQENERYGESDLEELGEKNPITAEKLEKKVKELDERLSKDPSNKSLKKGIKKLKKDYLPRHKKYEEQEKHLGNRNSYSKIDTDATFMRMKEDHMKNGQLKPGYNIQMGTQNQFIIGYSIHQRPSDAGLLIPHLEHLKEQYGRFPKNIIADAGYGSEENYNYLEKYKLTGYVKYNNFHYEQKRKFKKAIFRIENLKYDEKRDVFICPAKKKLMYLETEKYVTDNGYQTTRRIYQCENCARCKLRSQCHKSKYNRKIRISHTLNEYKRQARERLNSEEGKYYRSRRPIEVESVFGQIKHNQMFRRFMLRSLEKVKIEYGLLSIAHNLAKLWTKILGETVRIQFNINVYLNILKWKIFNRNSCYIITFN